MKFFYFASSSPTPHKTPFEGPGYSLRLNLPRKPRYIYANGDIYDGDFQRNQACGEGVYRYAVSGGPAGDCYVGSWERDRRHGRGFLRWANGSRYEARIVLLFTGRISGGVCVYAIFRDIWHIVLLCRLYLCLGLTSENTIIALVCRLWLPRRNFLDLVN